MAPFRLSLSALIVGLSVSSTALAIGFGELQLQSRLNQPLQAEIPILGVPTYARESIRVRVGRREDFAALGYDYSPEMDDVRTELQQRDNRLVLLLSSRYALREPLLNIVLVAEEGGTRYLRDYALLLDLPDINAPAAIRVASRGASDSRPAERPTVDTTLASPSSPRTTVTTPAATDLSATRYGPTRPGDTLSTIAHRLGHARGVSWQAFGAALFHANPQAFIAGDPNRLMAAVPLELPSADTVARYQRSDWHALFSEARQSPEVRTVQREPGAATEPVAAAIPVPTVAPEPAPTDTVTTTLLTQLQQQNAELKAELLAATERMRALEVQLSALDARYASVNAQLSAGTLPPGTTEATASAAPVEPALPAAAATAPAPATIDTAVGTTIAGETNTSETNTSETNASETNASETNTSETNASETAASDPSAAVTAPVTVAVRDTLTEARSASPAAVAEAEQRAANDGVVNNGALSKVMGPLLALAGLAVLGALFWQWRERRQLLRMLQPRRRTPHTPKPLLPLPEADEPVPVTVENQHSPDRRTLKLKQVQSALDTYLMYHRYDRATELLEQETHLAGDDLLLRRQLQRMQKKVREAQTEWQQIQHDMHSDQFDKATVTHVDKPTSRDDGKKTLG